MEIAVLNTLLMKYLFFLIFTFTFAQQTKFVDFKTVLGKIQINPTDRAVSDDVFYNLEVLNSIDTIKIDAQNMDFSDLTLNGKKVKFVNTIKQLQIIFPFKKGKNTLTFQYLDTRTRKIYQSLVS